MRAEPKRNSLPPYVRTKKLACTALRATVSTLRSTFERVDEIGKAFEKLDLVELLMIHYSEVSR